MEWIPVFSDRIDSMQVRRIARQSGVSRHEALGLLVHFWAWANHQTDDGFIEGGCVDDLLDAVGGSVEF
mgnify:FL=1